MTWPGVSICEATCKGLLLYPSGAMELRKAEVMERNQFILCSSSAMDAASRLISNSMARPAVAKGTNGDKEDP